MSEIKYSKTVLGANCRISGELTLDNDAVIMGEFQGVLRVRGMLEITDSARVSGTVIAGSLRLSGTAEADVVAEAGVELLAGARLSGRLYTSTLSIDEGAVIQCDVNVGPNAMEAASALLRQANAVAADQPLATQTEKVAAEIMSDEQIDESLETEVPEQVRTIPASLNNILQRRRSRVISATAGKLSPVAAPTAKAS